jgi:hypothetical protein
MSIKCQKLARNVNCFKGTVREVYKCIADHASKGATHNKGDKKKKHLPEDWTSIGYARMMMECNVVKTQTLTDILRQLKNSGAVEIKEVSGRKMYRFYTPWAEAHQWNDADLESFRCIASTRYANRMLEKSANNIDTTSVPHEGDSDTIYDGLTPQDGVADTAKGCNDEELHRDAVVLTPQNGTVTHLTELTALQKRVSRHTGVNSRTESDETIPVSSEQLEGSLTPDEEMMKIWAETHPKGKNGFSWSNFCHSDKTFRSGCLQSKAFHTQYQRFLKVKVKAVAVPVEDDYDLSVDFGARP